MTPEPAQSLAAYVHAGDVDGVVDLLVGLDERERKALAKSARGLRRALLDESDGLQPFGGAKRRRIDAASLAVFGTAGPAAAVTESFLGWTLLREQDRLVRARPKAWRDDWVRRAVEEGGHWAVVRPLIREGEADKPEGEAYLRCALRGMQQLGGSWWGVDRDATPLADILRDDAEFLAEDLGRLFELSGDFHIANTDWSQTPEQHRWSEALSQLAAEGVVSRDRLLDASLQALRRDLSPYEARWHHQFHDALRPSPDERRTRQDDYLALLASEDGARVAFATRALTALEKSGDLDDERLLEYVTPALLTPAKGHAQRTLKLLLRRLHRRPDLVHVGLPVVAEALGHDAREVQETALRGLFQHRDGVDEELSKRLSVLSDGVDPALTQDLAVLTREERSAEPATTAPPVPAPLVLGTERLPRLAREILPTARVLAEIETLEELLERAAILLERVSAAEEIELVVDGVARFAGQSVEPARADVLLARARERLFGEGPERWLQDVRVAAAVVVVRWLDRNARDRLVAPRNSPLIALTQRLDWVLAAIGKGQGFALLATPTHEGGWIDPLVAVQRLVAASDLKPEQTEVAQLVLRLAPDRRAEALDAAQTLGGESGRALRHALGGSETRPRLTRARLMWNAATQARDPDGLLAAAEIDLAEPPDEQQWRSWYREAGQAPAASPADQLQGPGLVFGWEPRTHLEAWLALVAPSNRERFYSIGVRRLVVLRGAELNGTEDVVAPLLAPTEPFGPVSRLLVALALGAEDVVQRTTAVDVLIEALGQRRVDGEELGQSLARVLDEHARAIPARWAPALDNAAAAGAVHARHVQHALEVLLGAADLADRRRLLDLVDLLRRLALTGNRRVELPSARAFLADTTPASKIGKAAREALSVTGHEAARA